jgi:hypothetical protein
MTNPMYFLLR